MIDRRFLRFLAVGVLNTIFGYCAFAALLFVGVHYSLAALLSTVAGVIFNFFTTGRLVFDSREGSRIWRFVGVYGVIYLLNVVCLRLFKAAGVDLYLAGALLVPPMAVLAFVLNRAFVFTAPAPGR